MIRPEMARKFIDQITEYTEYNINIMDESGVIIRRQARRRLDASKTRVPARARRLAAYAFLRRFRSE